LSRSPNTRPPQTKTLSRGRELVAIPGPSVIPDRVLAAMNRAMPNIYEGELLETSLSLFADLPAIARTEGEAFIAVSNGHGAWDMALTNTLSRGDKVLVLESGVFGPGWGKMGETGGLEIETLSAHACCAVEPAAVEERLRADGSHTIKAILIVHVDTANSVRNDIAAIRKAIDAAGHPALFMVDCIASLACDPFEMDAWGVDITVAGSQKGLMVPPGLGFVWASEKALAAYDSANLRAGYWDWGPRRGRGPHYLKYCGTPPVQHVFALREALDMLNDEGLENIWWRHQILADAVRAAVDAWGRSCSMKLAIDAPASRSNAVTTVLMDGLDPERLRSLAEHQAGLVLGVPLYGFEGRAFRIGHMGHLNPTMVLGTLGSIEAVLQGMGVKLTNSGVAAATAAIAPHLLQ